MCKGRGEKEREELLSGDSAHSQWRLGARRDVSKPPGLASKVPVFPLTLFPKPVSLTMGTEPSCSGTSTAVCIPGNYRESE